jgi:hypothetical protein
MPSRWPRAERLNAQRMADAISAATGVALRIEGPCHGGQVGALVGHPAIPAVRLYLTSDGPGYCLHPPLQGHSARTTARAAATGDST